MIMISFLMQSVVEAERRGEGWLRASPSGCCTSLRFTACPVLSCSCASVDLQNALS